MQKLNKTSPATQRMEVNAYMRLEAIARMGITYGIREQLLAQTIHYVHLWRYDVSWLRNHRAKKIVRE
jgi:hypothetical protein